MDKIVIAIISTAERLAKELNDSYVSSEVLFLALLEVKSNVSDLLNSFGINKGNFRELVYEKRNGRNVDSSTADINFDSLKRFTHDLNELARNGNIDPIIGRDEEIRRSIQVLSRRTKNNPVLIGMPGVGKTAIAEGLALRIVNGDVPETLLKKKVLSLDMGLLVAGA